MNEGLAGCVEALARRVSEALHTEPFDLEKTKHLCEWLTSQIKVARELYKKE